MRRANPLALVLLLVLIWLAGCVRGPAADDDVCLLPTHIIVRNWAMRPVNVSLVLGDGGAVILNTTVALEAYHGESWASMGHASLPLPPLTGNRAELTATEGRNTTKAVIQYECGYASMSVRVDDDGLFIRQQTWETGV